MYNVHGVYNSVTMYVYYVQVELIVLSHIYTVIDVHVYSRYKVIQGHTNNTETESNHYDRPLFAQYRSLHLSAQSVYTCTFAIDLYNM